VLWFCKLQAKSWMMIKTHNPMRLLIGIFSKVSSYLTPFDRKDYNFFDPKYRNYILYVFSLFMYSVAICMFWCAATASYMKMFGVGQIPMLSESIQRHSWQATNLFSMNIAEQNFPNVRHIHSQVFPLQPYVEFPGFPPAVPMTLDRHDPLGHVEDMEEIPALPPKTSLVGFLFH
jgi:hypothetical protein